MWLWSYARGTQRFATTGMREGRYVLALHPEDCFQGLAAHTEALAAHADGKEVSESPIVPQEVLHQAGPAGPSFNGNLGPY